MQKSGSNSVLWKTIWYQLGKLMVLKPHDSPFSLLDIYFAEKLYFTENHIIKLMALLSKEAGNWKQVIYFTTEV